MLSVPPHWFPSQSSPYQNWKASTYSLLVVTRTASVRDLKISKVYAPIDPEHDFNKMRIENWLAIGFKLGSSWLETCNPSYAQMLMGRTLMFYIPLKSWNNSTKHFASITHQPVASTPNRTKTNHCWLNHLQTLHTLNYVTLLVVGLRGSSQTPGVAKGKLQLISFPHSTWLTPEKKDKTIDSPSMLISSS